MDVGTLLSVSEAADELGVNRQKVLAFIDGGRLPAVRLGNGWWISVSDLTRFAQVERRPGRPLSATRAWRLLRDAETNGMVHVERGRVNLDGFQLVHLVRRRAVVHRMHVLDRLVGEVMPLLVAAGEAAARQHGFAPRSARQDGDGYLRRSAFDSLVERFVMVPAVGEEINVLLRCVDDEVWPFDGGELLVGPLTAAVDMAGDPVDDRSIDAAMPIIERYL